MMRKASDLQATRPGEAGRLWQQADREVVNVAAVLPLGNALTSHVTSRRVGNYQGQPFQEVLRDQLWVGPSTTAPPAAVQIPKRSIGKVTAMIPWNARPSPGAAGSGWLVTPGADTPQLLRVDPATNQVRAVIPLDGQPARLVEAAGVIWVTNFNDGVVQRVDPATNKDTGRIPVGRHPYGIDFAGGYLWVGQSCVDSLPMVLPMKRCGRWTG